MTSEAIRRRIENNIDRSLPHPIPLDAEDALAATPTAELLTKAYALTHRMTRENDEPGGCADRHEVSEARMMRDLITAEVLRRTGGQ